MKECAKCKGRGDYMTGRATPEAGNVAIQCEVCHGEGQVPSGFRGYLGLAKKKAVEAWHLLVAAGLAAGWVIYFVVEFLLHVLRLPHWH